MSDAQRLGTLVHNLPDYAIFMVDPAGIIIEWTEGAQQVKGYTAQEVLGRHFAMFYTSEDQAAGRPEQILAEAARNGRFEAEGWRVRKSGERFWANEIATAVRDETGTLVGLTNISRDLTERRQAEEALRASEARLDEDGIFKVGQDVTARLLAEDARRADEAERRELLEAEVAAATLDLRASSRRLLLVQEEERRKLALELHDEIGQMLTGLNFQLASASGVGGAPSLEEAQATVQALTEQVRQLSMDLRPQMLDRYGLLAAVEWYVEHYHHRTGITVHLQHQGLTLRYPPETEIAAFRVVQEALTNIAHHADVYEASVALVSDDYLLVVIQDQGRGFAPAQVRASSGLEGMRERVELLGGTFEVEAAPGAGVHITAVFPLDHEQAPRSIEELSETNPADECTP